MAQPVLLPDPAETIRVLAADSTRMNSQLLTEALGREKRFIVSEANVNARELAHLTRTERPQVALISSELEDNPRLGLEVVREIRSASPDTRIVVLLDESEPAAVIEAFRAGARGIFCRTESLKSLAKCIQSVHAGQVWANSAQLRYLLDALAEALPMSVVNSKGVPLLSRREQEVVHCVAEGLTNREIAGRLHLTEHTVKNYLFRIFDKLGVSSRVEVVLYAFSNGRTAFLPQTIATKDATAPTVEEPKKHALRAQAGASMSAPSRTPSRR